jgi:hypothetical protein
MIDAALSITVAVGAVALIYNLGGMRRLRALGAVLVLAPVLPFLLIRTVGALMVAGADWIVERIPGQAARIRAAERLVEPESNVVPFTTAKRRKH